MRGCRWPHTHGCHRPLQPFVLSEAKSKDAISKEATAQVAIDQSFPKEVRHWESVKLKEGEAAMRVTR